jgi:hypothetical protein
MDVKTGRSGQRYLKLYHEDLTASPAWKGLSPSEQGEHLRMLLLYAAEGKLPERWKRTAELRQVGLPAKPNHDRPKASPLLPVYDVWERYWERNRGEKYVWDAKQRTGLRRAWEKAGGDLMTFEVRVQLLWGHRQNWYQENASPCLVASHWNELAGGPKTARNQPPGSSQNCGRCGVYHAAIECRA